MTYSGAHGEYHDWEKISDIRTVFWVVEKNGTDSNRSSSEIGPVLEAVEIIIFMLRETIICTVDMQVRPMRERSGKMVA